MFSLPCYNYQYLNERKCQTVKLLIVRHGDPDYVNDILTEKGKREAEYLSRELCKVPVAAYYCSPLGRAKATAAYTLQKVGRSAEECLWLREFEAPIEKPNLPGKLSITWDWLPEDWTAEDRFFDKDSWYSPSCMTLFDVKAKYDWVCSELDNLLEKHGYRRKNNYYEAAAPHNDTIVFFCHFGVEAVLLSHLLNISPMLLWHGMVAAPSSVTTVATEERRPGIAYWRMLSFGECGHLYMNNEPRSFSARFSECYFNEGERLD